MLKRGLDILGAGVGLVALAPLLLWLAYRVRHTMGSPVIFRQKRPGLNGKPFQMLKFRTMSHQRDAEGNLLPDADRLSRFGQFLRSTSLDELPELWNVLKGDMSLVGPRPLRMRYLDVYTAEEARRHHVRPGITGWAQVNGRNAVGWDERLRMDVWYVDNRSFWLDIKILVRTVSTTVTRKGISGSGHATMVGLDVVRCGKTLQEKE